jgi:hypothetical protein
MPLINRATLDFLVCDWLDATGLTRLARFAERHRETFDCARFGRAPCGRSFRAAR